MKARVCIICTMNHTYVHLYQRVFKGGSLLIPKERDWLLTFSLNRIIEAEAPSRLVGIYSLARGLWSRVGTWELGGPESQHFI